MKNTMIVLTVLGFGWNHVLPDAQAATIDLAAAAGVFLANTVAGGDGTLANAKSGTPNWYQGSWSRLTDAAWGTKWVAMGANAWGGPYDGRLYEVQVLDSYRAKTYADGQAAAIYGQSPPLVNSSKPPGEWQTYDILFESPRWNEKGELSKKAIITVLHNGVVVQNRYEFTGGTDGISDTVPWRTLSKYPAPHPPECFIELQDHANPVRFRNIWIRSMHLGENQ